MERCSAACEYPSSGIRIRAKQRTHSKLQIMNKMLHDLYLVQQALEVAESAHEVAQALPALLASQIDGAAFEVVLDAGDAGLDQPAVDANGANITLPLVVGGKPYGLLIGRKSDAFTPTELAFILA